MEIVHHHFTSLDSTNNCAKRNAHLFDPSKMTIITSDEQTSGRGRGKRIWKSPAYQSIYASFCFSISPRRPDIGNLSQLLAISGCRVMEQLGFSPDVKWPNDLLLSQKKVGGILCEAITNEDSLCMINGIGLNINMPASALSEIPIPATSLFAEKGSPYDIREILHLLMANFTEDLERFMQEGFSPFLPKIKKLMSHSLNQPIRFHDQLQIWEGVVHSFNEDGSLNLMLPSQEVKKFISGEILYDTAGVPV